MIADSAAPTHGAAIKSHSCAKASPPANRAGPILRAGLTEVPVIGIQTMWTKTNVRPMASPANLGAEFSLAVVPSTTNTKIKVNTASAINAGTSAASPKLFAPVPVMPSPDVMA